MELKEAKCTACGASLKAESQQKTMTCQFCQTTIFVKHAIDFALVEVDRSKDIERYRAQLKTAITQHSVKEMLRVSALLKDLIPQDLMASYAFAYAKQQQNEPSFMKLFLKEAPEGTTEDTQTIIKHMMQKSDLRDKELILWWLETHHPQKVEDYLHAHADRLKAEDQYANIPRDVFICFSSKQNDAAQAVLKALEKEGHSVWIATRNLRPEDSENYWLNIEQALSQVRLVVVVSSQEAMYSKDVQYELDLARKHKKKLVEFKVDTEPHTALFKHVFDGKKWVEGFEALDAGIVRLKKRVFEELEQLKPIMPLKDVPTMKVKKPKRLVLKLGLLLVAMVVGAGAWLGVNGYTDPATWRTARAIGQATLIVTIEYNASIVLFLNQNHEVIHITGLNEDGQRVVDLLDLETESYEELIRRILRYAFLNNQIPDNGGILLGIESRDPLQRQMMPTLLLDIVDEVRLDREITTHYYAFELDRELTRNMMLERSTSRSKDALVQEVLSHRTSNNELFPVIVTVSHQTLQQLLRLRESYEIAHTLPVVTLHGDGELYHDVRTPFTEIGADAVDFEGQPLSVHITGEVNTDVLGTYVIDYIAIDGEGRESKPIKRVVHVVDREAPELSLEGSKELTIEVGSSFDDPGYHVSDNYDETVTVTVEGHVYTNTLGSYTLTYRAVDTSGNEATALKRIIHVVDTTPPVVTMMGEAFIEIELGETFTDPGVTVIDNHDSEPSLLTDSNVNLSALGSYVITYVAIDASGNQSEPLTRSVVVIEPIVVYQIDYVLNGGTWQEDALLSYQSNQTEIHLVEPFKEGYTLRGWYLDAQFNEAFDTQALPYEDLTLYARWQIQE